MQYGYTALMEADSNGDLNVVQCLVEVGVNLAAGNKNMVSGHVAWEYADV